MDLRSSPLLHGSQKGPIWLLSCKSWGDRLWYMYTLPCVVSEQLEDLLSFLMTVNSRYRPTVTDVIMQTWFNKDWKRLPNLYEELIPIRSGPAIVISCVPSPRYKWLFTSRKYTQTMASYCLLQGQALQGHGCTTQAHPVSLVMALFPTLDDDDNDFPLRIKRNGNEPTKAHWSHHLPVV